MNFKVLSFLIVTSIVMPCWTDNDGDLCNSDKCRPTKIVQLSVSNLNWPCESTKRIFIKSGSYVPQNVFVTRVQSIKEGVLVALPRYKHGVPFTLGKVILKDMVIKPYPCWSIQEERNCQALQSVVDIVLDNNSILWALDVGIVNTLEQPIQHCSPKILAINTIDDTVVRSIDLSEMVTDESRLQFLIVGKQKDNNQFVYVADAGRHSILVCDTLREKCSRMELPKTTSDTNDFLYIALATKEVTPTLFFTYLSSPRLYSINAEFLSMDDKKTVVDSIVDVGAKPHGKQMVLLGADGKSSLYFRYRGENDIYMWNSEERFASANLKAVLRGSHYLKSAQVAADEVTVSLEINIHDFITGRTGSQGALIILRVIPVHVD